MMLLIFCSIFVNFGLSVSYFIGKGEELNQCNAAKASIEANPDNCKDYENIYQLNCSDNAVLYCESNEDKISQIPNEQNMMILIIGSDPPNINVSNFPKEINISIYPLNFNVTEDSQSISRPQLCFIGCYSPVNKAQIFGFQITIIERPLFINHVSFFETEIKEGDYKIGSNLFECDYHFLKHPNYNNVGTQTFQFYLGDSHSLNKLSFTFTQDYWFVDGCDELEKHHFEIPYSIANILNVSTNDLNATFIVKDSSTVKFKPVGINYRPSSSDRFFYLQKGGEDLLEDI